MENPFITKGYVSPEYFCDREKETADLLEAAKSSRDVVLYGRRKQGKSALIKHVFHCLRKSHLTVWVDLLSTTDFSSLVDTTASAVLLAIDQKTSKGRKIWDSLIRLRPILSYDELSGNPNISFDLKTEAQQKSTFTELIKLLSEVSKNLIIAFDEFQQIRNYPEKSTEPYLRTLTQSLPETTFIYCGSDQNMLTHMFQHIDSPFYSSGQFYKLGDIEEAPYTAFIKSKFEKSRKKIDDTLIKDILEWCHFRTINVQILCHRLFASGHKVITDEILRDMKLTILTEKDDVYFALKRVIPAGQWRVMQAFAYEGKVFEPFGRSFMKKYGFTNSSIIRRALLSAESKGLIYRGGSEDQEWFELDDIFLRRWIEMKKF